MNINIVNVFLFYAQNATSLPYSHHLGT